MEREAQSIPEWIHALTAREISARQRFLERAPAWTPPVVLHLAHAVRVATSNCDAAELEWRARSLFAVLASQLADVQQESDMSAVDLHRVRRLSKDARYLLGLVAELAPGTDPGREKLDLSLREVHRALGGWHDATVALGDVRSFTDERGGSGSGAPICMPPTQSDSPHLPGDTGYNSTTPGGNCLRLSAYPPERLASARCAGSAAQIQQPGETLGLIPRQPRILR